MSACFAELSVLLSFVGIDLWRCLWQRVFKALLLFLLSDKTSWTPMEYGYWNRSKYSESICIENVIFLTTLVGREWSHSPVAVTIKSQYPLCLSLDLRKGKSFSSDYIRCREACRRSKGLNAPMSQHKDKIPSSSTVSVWCQHIIDNGLKRKCVDNLFQTTGERQYARE